MGLQDEIVTEQDRADIKNILARLGELVPVMDKAENCGVDCQAYRQSLAQVQDQLTNILQQFGE